MYSIRFIRARENTCENILWTVLFFVCLSIDWFLERVIDLLLHLCMHSLVAACMCPDGGWNQWPWCIRTVLYPTELPQGCLLIFHSQSVLIRISSILGGPAPPMYPKPGAAFPLVFTVPLSPLELIVLFCVHIPWILEFSAYPVWFFVSPKRFSDLAHCFYTAFVV